MGRGAEARGEGKKESPGGPTEEKKNVVFGVWGSISCFEGRDVENERRVLKTIVTQLEEKGIFEHKNKVTGTKFTQ